jgi:hypothetical protein
MLNRHAMSNITSGLIAGLIFGAVSVAMMLPMSFPDKNVALLAAFINRFTIGLVIGCVTLPSWPGWAVGLLFALLLSLHLFPKVRAAHRTGQRFTAAMGSWIWRSL